MMEMKVVTVRLPVDVDRQLRIVAAMHDQNRSEFIRETLENRLAELQEHQVEEEAIES